MQCITHSNPLPVSSFLDQEIISDAFPEERIRLIYLTDGNALPKLSSAALTSRNCNCLCICRPMAVDILLKQLTKEWKNVAYVLEDTAILSTDLEGINSTTVRRYAMEGKDVSKQLCNKVASYIKKHHLGDKMAGRERWNKEDKEFDFEGEDEMDRPYINMPTRVIDAGRRIDTDGNNGLPSGAVLHKEEFSLLW